MTPAQLKFYRLLMRDVQDVICLTAKETREQRKIARADQVYRRIDKKVQQLVRGVSIHE